MILSLRRALPPGIGYVSQWFGENPAMYAKFGLAGHEGIDYAVPIGTPVMAAHDGLVIAGENDTYGRYVKVVNAWYSTVYAHLSEVQITPGADVKAGDVLGLSGNTGNSTGPHLHWGLRVIGMRNPAYKDYIDPVPFRDADG